MNRLTIFLDWLDNAAGGLIRLAYLLAGITAIAVYFGAGSLPAAIENPLNAALPWSLAFAVETHTYITARRVRAAWQDKDAGALKVNLVILGGLLAFSAWNQLGYLAETWHPPVSGVLALPGWLAYVVRALVVPSAFMAAAFLAPMAEPIAAQIETEARSVLADVFKIARKQRRKMLAEAEKTGRDMTGALVELVPDPETRRIISHAYGAIGAPVQVTAIPVPASVAEKPSTRPPTGGGTPTKAQVRTDDVAPPGVLQLPAPRTRQRTAAQGRARGSNPRHVRTTESVEAKARGAWRAEMSVSQLARAAGISRNSAAKWVRIFEAEQAAQVAQ